MLHCDRPVAGTFPTRRSREPLPGSPVPVPLRHGRQMGHYATGPGPRRGGLLPWPLLRDGDRLPVLIDWPATGKARAPATWPQLCLYIPVVGRRRAAPELDRKVDMTYFERIDGGGLGTHSCPLPRHRHQYTSFLTT